MPGCSGRFTGASLDVRPSVACVCATALPPTAASPAAVADFKKVLRSICNALLTNSGELRLVRIRPQLDQLFHPKLKWLSHQLFSPRGKLLQSGCLRVCLQKLLRDPLLIEDEHPWLTLHLVEFIADVARVMPRRGHQAHKELLQFV